MQVIGTAALLLQADYARGTKDSDSLETREVTPELKAELLKLAGEGTKLAKQHRLYVSSVYPGRIRFSGNGPCGIPSRS